MRQFLFVAAALLSATQVFAATYTVTPAFAGAFSTDGMFTPIAGYNTFSGIPAILQIDFILSFSNPAPGQLAFGAVTFDITYDGRLSNLSVPGWQATNPTVDTNGAAPGGLFPLFANNGDFSNGTDLIDIVVGVAAGLNPASALDPRVKVGLGAGTNIGTVFFDYNGGGPFTIDTKVKSASYMAAGGVLMIDEFFNDFIPEPTSGVLAGLALVGAAARRRV